MSKGIKLMNVLKKIFGSRTMSMALEQFGTLSIRDFLLLSLLGILIVTIIILVRILFEKETELSDILAGIVLAVYVSIIIQLTLVCRGDNSRIGIELDIFHGLRGTADGYYWLMMAYIVLNCILFVPYGFILSLFSFINKRKAWVQCMLVFLISLISTLTIETAQLITKRGYYEVQDIFCNVLGGVIGWLIFYLIYKIICMISGRNREE